jgi:hypothetical protein
LEKINMLGRPGLFLSYLTYVTTVDMTNKVGISSMITILLSHTHSMRRYCEGERNQSRILVDL